MTAATTAYFLEPGITGSTMGFLSAAFLLLVLGAAVQAEPVRFKDCGESRPDPRALSPRRKAVPR